MSDYNAQIIEEFRANAGRLGGTWEGRDLLLLTTTGRKTARKHTTPMVFTRDGERLLVYASKAGAPTHPDWYLNLVADPHVVIEVGPDRYDAVATPLEGEERAASSRRRLSATGVRRLRREDDAGHTRCCADA